MYYAGFGMLALVLHLIINVDVFTTKDDGSSPVVIRYRLFLLAVVAYFVSDILWGLLYEKKLITLCYWDTVLYFVAMALSILFWTRYVVAYLDQDLMFSRFITVAGWINLIFVFFALMVNVFVPSMFYFTEQNIYRPGQSRYIALGLQVMLYVITSVYTLMYACKKKGRSRLHHLTIGLSGIIMTVFIVLQTCYPLLPFYAIGCLIAVCCMHAFVREDERMDQALKLSIARQAQQELEERIALQDQLLEQENEKQRAYAVITAMTSNFHGIYYIDLEKDQGICYRSFAGLPNPVQEGDHFLSYTKFRAYADNFILEEDREGFMAFVDPDSIRRQLKGRDMITYCYRSVINGEEHHEMLRFTPARGKDEDPDSRLRGVCAGFSDVAQEVLDTMSARKPS